MKKIQHLHVLLTCIFAMHVSISYGMDETMAAEAQPAESSDAPAPSPDQSIGGGTPAEGGGSQLKWPDSIELKEDDKGLVASASPKIKALSAQVKEHLNKMSALVEEITKKREELFTSYFEFDNTADVFLQTSTQAKGALEQSTQLREKK